jgi:hyperosmotically inducible protein
MKRLTSIRGLEALAIALVVSLASCSTTQPVREQISDSAITADVKARFAADNDVSGMNIDVTTQEGVVYLMGRVRTEEEKREAADIARKVSGVKEVKNMLNVGDKS